MIPRLINRRATEMPASGFLGRLVEAGFGGDIETGRDSAVVASTDNSIYEISKAGILYPRDGNDLRVVAKTLAEQPSTNTSVAPWRHDHPAGVWLR